ncbi:MAG: hypothetical protein A3G32_01515 [Deltaproteobacteria bacterium RIFCSPLOWO2_12_FULL_40_28]|nr:MAG: hypothetical protein A3C45_06260 [Deltaproteobacteria bacterium RIFCSPHIGHO2_02_FULL_40_28]OGQ18811.1 MAG: hypothetical protein A3E27_08895 [Deltaproteobacteria bacterium RIFCSPHIGHO2_12_FULL_40_32]OGQ40056.1 MAG: hypothetical protein A3I69_01425 [Deltaproteobacteria bacterium RIFCSPLOWO2_02_FULL_40_36]OGQ53239.1 MAG: hypothetical protein A3G32_01515 [Deltaproteobacteria bacterium RIFCSPLOWO2_12_FULL_40_28]
MTTISYSESGIAEKEAIREYITDYCTSQGIDPNLYLSSLDGVQTVDPALFQDPVFQAYWQLAYVRLMSILDPELVQSLDAEIQAGNIDALYSKMGEEDYQAIQQILMDSPEILAFTAQDAGDEASAQQLLNSISSSAVATTGSTEYVDEQARAMAEALGLNGMYDYLIGTEEGIKTTEAHLMEGLGEMDMQITQLSEALRSGEISAEEFAAQTEQVSMYRELYVGLIQDLEGSWNNTIEMFSQLVKTRDEGLAAVTRNLSA